MTYHVIFAFSMTTDRIITSPEEEIRLAFVVLHLEVVHFAVAMVWTPDQAAPSEMRFSIHSAMLKGVLTYS